jgi:hypothetical protein
MSSVDPLFREKLKAVMTLWIDETEKYLKKAQENGYLKKTANTRQLAKFIVATDEQAGKRQVKGNTPTIVDFYN